MGIVKVYGTFKINTVNDCMVMFELLHLASFVTAAALAWYSVPTGQTKHDFRRGTFLGSVFP